MAAAANHYVDESFSASEHLPESLQKLLRPLEVTTCQGPFPVLTMVLASMAGLTNGATVQLWSAGPTPISAMASYGGDAQQGKSRLTAAVSAMNAAADEAITDIVHARLDAMPAEQGVEKPTKLTVQTIGLQDFTPTELFARCSGDWEQIKDQREHLT